MTIKNIVFSGGALKGWAYIGTIRALNEYSTLRNQLENVAGVSIGSIFGLLYLLNIPWEYLLDKIMNLNFLDMIDINLDILLNTNSLILGKNFKEYVCELMSLKVDPEITFKKLYSSCNIKFTTCAINLSIGKFEYFNYLLTPDIKVIDAVMASASLPLLFPAYSINGNYYYDGGFINNCPVNLFDPLETIGFDLFTNKSIKKNNIARLIEILLTNINNFHVDKSIYENIYVVIVDKYSNHEFNINQSRDDIFNIYMHGYILSKEILHRDFYSLPWN